MDCSSNKLRPFLSDSEHEREGVGDDGEDDGMSISSSSSQEEDHRAEDADMNEAEGRPQQHLSADGGSAQPPAAASAAAAATGVSTDELLAKLQTRNEEKRRLKSLQELSGIKVGDRVHNLGSKVMRKKRQATCLGFGGNPEAPIVLLRLDDGGKSSAPLNQCRVVLPQEKVVFSGDGDSDQTAAAAAVRPEENDSAALAESAASALLESARKDEHANKDESTSTSSPSYSSQQHHQQQQADSKQNGNNQDGNALVVVDDTTSSSAAQHQDNDGASSDQSEPSQHEDKQELPALESEILLHETTLESLHSKLTVLNQEIASERQSISDRKDRIEGLERRAAGLKVAKEESVALVKSIEQTLKKCVGRLRKRLGEAYADGGSAVPEGEDAEVTEAAALNEAEDSPAQYADALLDTECLDGRPSVGSSSGHVAASSPYFGVSNPDSNEAVHLQAVGEDEQEEENQVEQDEDGENDYQSYPSADIVPFHENHELMRRMWSQGKAESSTLERVRRSPAGKGCTSPCREDAKIDDHKDEEKDYSIFNFGSKSTAMLPYLLPPISSQDVLQRILTVVGREVSAKRLEHQEDDGEALAACIESFLRGTCLDPLSNTGYDRLTDNDCGNDATAAGQSSQEETISIDPTIALCPYELGGVCADSTCPYQHLDGSNRQKRPATVLLLAGLRDLHSMKPPLAPLLEEDDDDATGACEGIKRKHVDDHDGTSAGRGSGFSRIDATKYKRRKKDERRDSEISNTGSSVGAAKDTTDDEENKWNGTTELDFVSIPQGRDEAEDSGDEHSNRPIAITDAGAPSDGEQSEGEKETDEEGLVPQVTEALRANVPPFWHFPLSSKPKYQQGHHDSIVQAVREGGRGSISLEDLLLLVGFSVETSQPSVDDDEEPANDCVKFVRLPTDGTAITEIATTMDAIQLCIHSGRYDIAYAVLEVGRKLAASNEDILLGTVLDHAAEFIDEAAMCCTETFASNAFNVQVSFAVLADFIRSYSQHLDADADTQHSIDWSNLLRDCYYIQDESSDSTSQLSKLRGSSARHSGSVDVNEYQTQEALWVQKLQAGLVNILPPAGHDATHPLLPDAATRQLIRCATIGNELASLLIHSTTKKSRDVSIHSMVHLILEPAWAIIRRYIGRLSKATHQDGCDATSTTTDPAIIGCCLVGPMLFTSVSLFYSFNIGEMPFDDEPYFPSVRRLDPKSIGTLITLANFLNKAVRALRRSNENICAGRRQTGSLLAGDLVIAPLHSLCVSVSAALGSFGQAKQLLEEGLSLPSSKSTASETTRTCLIHSELLWSQYFYMHLLSRWVGIAATNICRGDFDLVDFVSARRLLQYGVFLRQFPLHGDCSMVKQAGSGRSLASKQALDACEQVVSSVFNTDIAKHESGRIVLQAKSSVSHDPVVFPTSVLLLRNLSHLTFSGYGTKCLPAALGSCLPLLEVLNLSNNALSQLPLSIGQLVDLFELNISSNQLEEIPDCIGNLSKLRFLYASSNRIQSLPSSLLKCTSLEVLDLRDNLIEVIPSELPLKLFNLRSYLLDGNPM